ncbi:hypothetical protein DPMN_184246 [Dreissena polymorpha]|uniref:Uncharacterized protein n=1 Tax=Dreissena polymorpha TaxID=45954 RepID=A0A9D4DIF8_DREPO|nr:hypothetical protein DPMN_184246 [Dreissena polymorpha]
MTLEHLKVNIFDTRVVSGARQLLREKQQSTPNDDDKQGMEPAQTTDDKQSKKLLVLLRSLLSLDNGTYDDIIKTNVNS